MRKESCRCNQLRDCGIRLCFLHGLEQSVENEKTKPIWLFYRRERRECGGFWGRLQFRRDMLDYKGNLAMGHLSRCLQAESNLSDELLRKAVKEC